MKEQILILCILFMTLQTLHSQEELPFKYIDLTYREYIELVKTHNIRYASEKLNINISEAAIEAAKVFSDPFFSVGYTSDSENRINTGYGIYSELAKTVDLGGERKARIDLARSEKELTIALVADYFRNLRAEATLYYLEAMKHQQLFIVRYNSYQMMKKLSEADSIRFKLGNIMEIDAIQSKLEAGILYNELIHATAEWKNSLSDLSMMTGISKNDTLFLPTDHLHESSKSFDLNNLIIEAQIHRADLQVALLNREVAERSLKLTKKQRNTDIDLKLGLENSYLSGVNSPAYTGIIGGVAIPLKFSNFNKGELKMAEFRIEQADNLYEQAELQIKTEIIQAWEYYADYCNQVNNFNNELLKNAENVRKGKSYSYQRGETSLLEVLNAQRTYNDIQTKYYETLYYQAAALVELENAAGIWDIDF